MSRRREGIATLYGNAGIITSFRIGIADAEYMVRVFFPAFTQDEFVNLPRYVMYLKLMVDGTVW